MSGVAERAAVLVPVHDEAPVVGAVVAELRRHFDLVVCVDDGSRDGSGAEARRAGGTVLTHRVNLGQGAALRTGFDHLLRRTDVEHVVTFDADGQHAVADALAMLSVARESGVDVVLGSRTLGSAQGQPFLRRLVLRGALRISRWHSGLALSDTHNGLRVLSRHAVRTLALRQRGMAHASEIEALIARHRLSWIDHPVTITYDAYSRAKGQGSLNAFNVVYDLVAARFYQPS
jgi:glycosyltransferase involved in cell wall biosynthesis